MKIKLTLVLFFCFFLAKAQSIIADKKEDITINMHLKAESAIRLSYYDDYLVKNNLIFRNNSKKDTVITKTFQAAHTVELRYSVFNGSTNQNYFYLFLANKGNQIDLELQDFKLKNLDTNKFLMLSDYLELDESIFSTKSTNGSFEENIKTNEEILNANLKKIDLLTAEKALTDSVAALWKEMAKNYYYVKLSRQNYRDKSSYFEKLVDELRNSLTTKKAINSTFLNSTMYFLGNYNKNKNNLNYNLKTFIEELIQINTEKRFKTGIAFQALFDFSEKESKMYAESHALFNKELNDPVFQKQSYASLIVPNENAVDKRTIKLVTTTKEPLTLADIFKRNKGKVIVFDLWASWCIPCINEFPFLEKTKVKFLNKNVVFIGIGLDKDNKEKDWKNILLKSKISAKNQFRVIESSNKLISTLYKIETIPRYLVFDKEGMLVNDHFSKPSEQDFEGKLLSYISTVNQK